jgi:GNAT superfamily N-acetyltransferase
VPPIRQAPRPVVIRPAAKGDVAAIEQLALDVVREVYGDLFPGEVPPPLGKWSCGLVAEIAGRIVGVVVSDDDWVEDLWVTGEHRRCGIGSVLLAAAERQIAERGCAQARLRVVARNLEARRFYQGRGWAGEAGHAHEKWGFAMVEMTKTLAA